MPLLVLSSGGGVLSTCAASGASVDISCATAANAVTSVCVRGMALSPGAGSSRDGAPLGQGALCALRASTVGCCAALALSRDDASASLLVVGDSSIVTAYDARVGHRDV